MSGLVPTKITIPRLFTTALSQIHAALTLEYSDFLQTTLCLSRHLSTLEAVLLCKDSCLMQSFATCILDKSAKRWKVTSTELRLWFELSVDEEGSLVDASLFHFSLPDLSEVESWWDFIQGLRMIYTGLSERGLHALGSNVLANYSVSFTTVFSLVMTRCLLSRQFKAQVDDCQGRQWSLERFNAVGYLAQLESEVTKRVMQYSSNADAPVVLHTVDFERVKDIWTRFTPPSL